MPVREVTGSIPRAAGSGFILGALGGVLFFLGIRLKRSL